jgi:hypothetical protein
VDLESTGAKALMLAVHLAALVVGIVGGMWFFEAFT